MGDIDCIWKSVRTRCCVPFVNYFGPLASIHCLFDSAQLDCGSIVMYSLFMVSEGERGRVISNSTTYEHIQNSHAKMI